MSEFHDDHGFPTPWFIDDVDPLALTETAAFAAYVTRVLSERDETAGRADWFVPMTTLWWLEGDQMLGSPAIRHWLTPLLEKADGHIGYDIRPSARRQGHATTMLAAALPTTHSLGITRALLT
ncbi:GNAT family N-acetyltransferase [Streptomyces sp. NPDC002550]